MAYWIVVGSEENFRIAQERGFDTFGANLTTVGAAANVYVVNVAARAGYRIGFVTFLRYGALVTLASATIAALYLWLRYLAF